MRASAIALLCSLAAAAVLLSWHSSERQSVQPAPPPATDTVPDTAPAPHAEAPDPLPRAAAPVTAEVAVAAKPSRVASGPVRSAFTLSSDHQALIREALIAAADHELLEHEPRDDPWASDAEQLIRQELARHESAGNIDVVAVDCRQTVCAIQAFAYGENGHRAWVDALDELYRQTLAGMFDSINTAFPTKGTRSAVLTFLHRAPAPKP
jgi:hypothetical protein